MTEKFYFSTADILVFSASLLISAGIGVFYAYKDRNNKSVDKYYYGSRKMSPVSVGISISVSFISAVTVLGYPAETYLYGTVSLWLCFQLVIPNIIAYFYYIPMVHSLKLKTIYEYLELRFSVSTRKLAAAIEIMNTLLYMGSTMYLPALALNAVTPINLNTSIILTSFICTLYTAFGGIKAVVWTDVIQAFIMFIGSTAALIVPTVYVGGPSQVYEALKRGERLNFFEFDPDPRIRSTFWTIMVGTSIAQTTLSCCNQSIVQRYSSCKNVSDARKAAIISLFPKILLSLMCLCTGCAAFAFYENCDPLKSKKITKADQIVPFMVTELFQGVPGCAGILVAAAYSGTMSTVSTGINSASSLVLQDFILAAKPDFSEKTKMRISFWIAILIGAISTGLAFLASVSVDTIVSLVMKIRGTFGGPMVGVFTLGLFVPWSNTKGAVCGLVSGVGLTAWLAIGGLINGKDPNFVRKKPLSIEGCSLNATTVEDVDKDYNPIYAVSYMYYSAIGLSTTIIIGMIVSLLTKSRNNKIESTNLTRSLFCNNPKSSKKTHTCLEEKQKFNLEDD